MNRFTVYQILFYPLHRPLVLVSAVVLAGLAIAFI